MKYQKPKGKRLKRFFLWIEVHGFWWDKIEKKWVKSDSDEFNPDRGGYSTSCWCRTIRAFRRHLKNHPEIKGHTVYFINRYVDYHVEVNA